MTVPDSVTRTFDGLASRIDAAGFHTVGFTSALLGEGVSTIALGTALGLAGLRRETVLLIDANWLQPSLTGDARLEEAPGLADHLARKADLHTVTRRSKDSRLGFVPVGDRGVARPTLRALSALVQEVDPGHTVLVDLPPILPGEAFVLPWAALLDQLFVVLREGATPLPLVRRALGRITPATAPYLVLNRTSAPTADVPAALVAVRA